MRRHATIFMVSSSVSRGLWVVAGKHSAAVSRERCIESIQTKRKEYTGHCDSPAHGSGTPGEPKKRPIDLRSALRGPRLSTAAGELGSRAEGASNVKNKMRRREERRPEICESNTATPDLAALFRLDFHFCMILVYIRSIHLFSSSSTYSHNGRTAQASIRRQKGPGKLYLLIQFSPLTPHRTKRTSPPQHLHPPTDVPSAPLSPF